MTASPQARRQAQVPLGPKPGAPTGSGTSQRPTPGTLRQQDSTGSGSASQTDRPAPCTPRNLPVETAPRTLQGVHPSEASIPPSIDLSRLSPQPLPRAPFRPLPEDTKPRAWGGAGSTSSRGCVTSQVLALSEPNSPACQDGTCYCTSNANGFLSLKCSHFSLWLCRRGQGSSENINARYWGGEEAGALS